MLDEEGWGGVRQCGRERELKRVMEKESGKAQSKRKKKRERERKGTYVYQMGGPAMTIMWPSLQTGPPWTRNDAEGFGRVADHQTLVAGTTAVTHAGLAVL